MAKGGWRMLRAGSGLGAVLGIDFTLAKVRAQANFGDLAPHLPEGYAVWGTDETVWSRSPGTPCEHLDDWLRRGCGVDRPVRAVFGFCASAALASVLAGRLRDAGDGSISVVLFDPVMVTGHTLLEQAEQSMRRLPAGAPAGGGESAGGDGLRPEAEPVIEADLAETDLAETDLGELATGLAHRYATAATAFGAAQSIPASIVDQLCQRVEANLRFLTLCGTAWPAGSSATSSAASSAGSGTAGHSDRPVPHLVVLSRHHLAPERLSEAPSVRLDVATDELLSHPDAARAAARFLPGVVTDGWS